MLARAVLAKRPTSAQVAAATFDAAGELSMVVIAALTAAVVAIAVRDGRHARAQGESRAAAQEI